MATIAELLEEKKEMRFVLQEGDKVAFNGKPFGEDFLFEIGKPCKVTGRDPMGFEVEVHFNGMTSEIFIYPHAHASFDLVERVG